MHHTNPDGVQTQVINKIKNVADGTMAKVIPVTNKHVVRTSNHPQQRKINDRVVKLLFVMTPSLQESVGQQSSRREKKGKYVSTPSKTINNLTFGTDVLMA